MAENTKIPANFCRAEVKREIDSVKIVFHCENCPFSPSVEDEPICMEKAIEKLGEVKEATEVLFHQKRIYEYDDFQTNLLKEISFIYNEIIKSDVLIKYDIEEKYTPIYDNIYSQINQIIFGTLKKDPIKAFIELRRLKRRLEIQLNESNDKRLNSLLRTYSDKIKTVIELLDSTKMITLVKTYLSKYSDDRMLYRLYLFTPIIKPDFMYTKLMASYPMNGIEIDSYMVNDSEIAIFKFHDSVKYLYHLVPPEFKLSEEKYELIDLARQIITQHQPEKNDFIDPSRMRDVFYNISFELLEELAQHKKIDLSKDEFDELAKIVVRYSVGFGLIEVLLSDEQVQDVSVNSPYGTTPIYILHEKYDDCVTNIFPTKDESESWATKLRMLSGRPLDEANPILDTELELPNASIRTSSITKPLDPTGLAFSFRRHRDKPWTLPLFIKYKTINAFAAGLISFLVDGTRSFLIAGTRGSGKTSLLSSVLIEIMRRYRIITVEDTLELPVEPMRKLGYNIQPMKVSSALNPSKNEMDASNGIRSTLRLGDSSLIVGEVRSKEAIALYEAMRVGAAANVVAGTIHGDNPYGVFDRVVNDIGVPKISFKATDILVIVQPLKSADGLHKIRRVTQITEVRKDWENDPLKENGFVNLMEYDPTQDELVPTQELINGDSDILKIIAGNIKELASNWDAVLENITMRGKVKQYMVNKSLELDDPSLLEADFVILGNDLMHNSISEISEQYGGLDYEKIFEVWQKKYDYVVQNKANYQKQF